MSFIFFDFQDTQSSTKQKKINSKEGAELMRAFDKPSDDKNGSPVSGQASSPGSSSTRPEPESVVDSEPAAQKPSKQKDVVRARASHFDKNQKLLATLVSEHAAALTAATEVARKHDSERAELKHFFDILTVREKLLDILANKTAVELKTFLDTESKESISCQPVPEPQLRTCLVAADLDPLVKKVLAEETNDGVENNCTEVKNMIAIHSQVRTAVKTSARDIENAVRSKVKRKEAAAKKAAKEKEKETLKEQKAQAAAAKAKAGAASPGSGAQPTLLKVDIQKFKAQVQTFSNFDDFGKAKISGEQPFLITNFGILQEFLKDNVALKCQVVNFGNQFLGTQICKQTGRAQCPVMGDDAQEKVGAFFDKVTGSFQLPLPASEADAERKVLKPLLHSALFGFSADMEYAGIEDKALGQLRFVHSGVRKVCMIKITDFIQLMAQPPSNMGELIQAWKFLRFEDLEAKGCDKVIPAVQTPGSVLYVPPAWLVAEKVENGSSVVGLRRSLMVKSGTEEIEQMIKLLDSKHPLQEIARSQLAIWNQEQKKSA